MPLRRGGLLGKLSGYTLNTVVLGIAGIAVIPAQVHAGGVHGWASVAVGQAVGAVTGVITGFGWGVTGPSRVARGRDRRAQLLWESVIGRLVVAVVVIAPALLASTALSHGEGSTSRLACLTTAAVAFSGTWYFVGTGQAWTLLLLDTGPRLCATIIAIVAMSLRASIDTGLVIQLVGILSGGALSTSAALRTEGRDGCGDRGLRIRVSPLGILWKQRAGVSTSVVNISYNSFPVILVGAIRPDILPVFALLDKLQKQVASAYSPIVSVIQGWVPAAKTRLDLNRRGTLSLKAAAILGAVVTVVSSVCGPWLGDLLSHGRINAPALGFILTGFVLALILFEAVLGRAVMSAEDIQGAATRANIMGAVVGVTFVVATVPDFGLFGALLGVIAGYVVTVTFEMRARRSTRHLMSTLG